MKKMWMIISINYVGLQSKAQYMRSAATINRLMK